MTVGIYMDVHIPRAITNGLRLREVNVLTAQEDGAITLEDSDLLDCATELRRLLYSQDDDLLAEANYRLSCEINFSEVIYSHQLKSPIEKCIEDLEIIAKTFDFEEVKNVIEFIPF